MTGVEYPLWREDLSFVADFISGTNSASVAVTECVFPFESLMRLSTKRIPY